jgi:L-proline cis-4-hydroxylase
MTTSLLHRVPLDLDRLGRDLARAWELPLEQPYAEFSAGTKWSGLMLWTPGGRADSGVLADYDFELPARPTVHGRALGYLSQLIEDNFVTSRLLFARMAVMREGTLLPHRDHIELERPAGRTPGLRLHLPLQTHENALFFEEGTVFRMRRGEVWSLDVRRLHSAAVFGPAARIHLLLDFAGAGLLGSAVRFEIAGAPGIPGTHVVDRPDPRPAEAQGLAALAAVIDPDNVDEITAILIKKAYRTRVGADFVWNSLRSVAAASAYPELVRRVSDLEMHCTLGVPAENARE